MPKKAAKSPIYKVMFMNQGKVYELYARHVYSSDMPGFINIEDFVFGERSGLLIDPSEEKLKNEFGGVKRSFVPIYSVIRVDEVVEAGESRILAAEGGGNVAAFPGGPEGRGNS